MEQIIRITAAARFSGSASLKTLKQQWQAASGQDGRRLSRLSLLAALGAAELRGLSPVRADCAVYLTTPFASPSLFDKMADNVLNHAAAMPFDFMANLHNAPAFHAAQALGVSGATLVLAADQRPQSWTKILHLAAHALRSGSDAQIAVGFAYEGRQESVSDGSVWLLLECGTTGRVLDLHALPSENSGADDGQASGGAYWQGLAHWLFGQNETGGAP